MTPEELAELEAEADRRLALEAEADSRLLDEKPQGEGLGGWLDAWMPTKSAPDIPELPPFLEDRMKDVESIFTEDIPTAVDFVSKAYDRSQADPLNKKMGVIAGLPRGAAQEAWSRIPEGSGFQMFLDTAASAVGAMLGKTPTGVLAKSIAAPHLMRKAEQVAGILPDTTGAQDIDQLASEFTKGWFFSQGAGRAAQGGAKAVNTLMKPVETAGQDLKNFLDPLQNRANAFLDPSARSARGGNTEGHRLRTGETLKEALQHPEIEPLIYARNTDALRSSDPTSKFTLIEQNIENAIAETGPRVDAVIAKLPQTPIRFGDIDLGKVRNKAYGQGPEIYKRPAKDVLDTEMLELAADSGYFTQQEIAEFKTLIDKERARKELTPQEAQFYQQMMADIDEIELTPQQIREYKTKFDSAGRYDRKSDPDYESRADVYRDLGSAFRAKLGDLAQKAGYGDEFTAVNKQYQRLLDLQPMATARAIQAESGQGRAFQTPAFQAKENPGMIEGIRRRALGEIDKPEVRLERGDTRPGMGLSRPIVRGIEKSLTGTARAVEEAVTRPARMAGAALRTPMAAGVAGMAQTLQNTPEGGPTTGGLGSFLEAQEAQAEAPGALNIAMPEVIDELPRESARWTPDVIQAYSEKIRGTPFEEPGRGLLLKMVEAKKAGDNSKFRKLVADVSILYPSLFEAGTGIDGRLFHKEAQQEYLAGLQAAVKRGTLDPTVLGMQMNSFADPLDGRVLPIPVPPGAGSGAPLTKGRVQGLPRPLPY